MDPAPNAVFGDHQLQQGADPVLRVRPEDLGESSKVTCHRNALSNQDVSSGTPFYVTTRAKFKTDVNANNYAA